MDVATDNVAVRVGLGVVLKAEGGTAEVLSTGGNAEGGAGGWDGAVVIAESEGDGEL